MTTAYDWRDPYGGDPECPECGHVGPPENDHGYLVCAQCVYIFDSSEDDDAYDRERDREIDG